MDAGEPTPWNIAEIAAGAFVTLFSWITRTTVGEIRRKLYSLEGDLRVIDAQTAKLLQWKEQSDWVPDTVAKHGEELAGNRQQLAEIQRSLARIERAVDSKNGNGGK